ncbi:MULTISPECIES: YcxB family protein [Nitratireductor]|uniref:YcxB family protein n=1 Tax=Nitratireductor TaxID=245876 RepID=UPI000FD9A60E|nr:MULTISPECIES: YcxB family protein [Nitratireductor]
MLAPHMPDEGGIEIRYRLTEQDYLAMMEARTRWRTGRFGRAVLWSAVLLNIGVGAWLLVEALVGAAPLAVEHFLNLGLAALIVAWLFVYLPWLRRRNFRRMKLADKPVRLVADRKAVSLQIGDDDSRTAWRDFERGQRTAAHFFFWLNPAIALIVPRRAFPDDALDERFWRLAQDGVSTTHG